MFHNILTGTSAAGGMSSILFLVLIFVVFYFFLIRPENKRKKKLTEMRNNISLGDEIVTIGGIMGKVVQVTEDTVTFATGEEDAGDNKFFHQAERQNLVCQQQRAQVQQQRQAYHLQQRPEYIPFQLGLAPRAALGLHSHRKIPPTQVFVHPITSEGF